MLFFTRELFDAMQGGDGPKCLRAEREWRRRGAVHVALFNAITPMLPRAVVRLVAGGLHDAVIATAAQRGRRLALTVDARSALGAFRGQRLVLRFDGVRGRIDTAGLVGEWWNDTEVRLAPDGGFGLDVFMNKRELTIEATGLTISKLSAEPGRRRRAPAA